MFFWLKFFCAPPGQEDARAVLGNSKWRSCGFGEQAGARDGDRSLGSLVLLRSWAWAPLPRGSRSAAWTAVQPLGGWASFGAGPLPSPVLGGESCSAAHSRTSVWIWPRNNKPNRRSNTAYQESQETTFVASLLLSLLSRHQLEVKESRLGHWQAQVYVVHGPGRLTQEALFSCWLQVIPGPRLLTMQMQ